MNAFHVPHTLPVDHVDHLALLRPGVPEAHERGAPPTWLELGSGRGAFTLALAELLGADATIISVDRDEGVLRDQARAVSAVSPGITLTTLAADFTEPLPVPLPPLDGVLMANSLHFVADKEPLLRRLVDALLPGGRFLLVEYDADQGNPWVPYPLSARRWERLTERVGLAATRVIGRRPSRFLGSIYSALSLRP